MRLGKSPFCKCGMRQVAIALPLIPGCWIGCGTSGPEAPLVLAKAGQTRITGDDISYRNAVEEAYGNDSITDSVALVALVNDALEHELAQSFGMMITPEEIARLNKHVDQTTRAPEILASVKHAFGDDRAAYERIYLAPRIINRKLRAFFSRNAEVHARERVLIEQAYALARSGMALTETAQACDLDYSSIEFVKRNNTVPALLRQYLPTREESLNGPLSAIVGTMIEGEIYKDIVEDDRGYMVIRLVQRNEKQYKLEAIGAGKQPFDVWFREQAAKIEPEIFDRELANNILRAHPNMWWVRKWFAQPEIGDK